MTAFRPSFNQGDVIVVAYPFEVRAGEERAGGERVGGERVGIERAGVERAGGRKRPALVVSATEFNAVASELVIAQITGRLSAPPRPGDYRLQDWEEANLPRAAMVRARLATLPAALALRHLGALTGRDFAAAMTALQSALGWPDQPSDRPPDPPPEPA